MEPTSARRRVDDAVAILIGLGGVALSLSPAYRSVLPGEDPAWWWTDLATGVASCLVLVLRRRAPVSLCLGLSVLACVSTTVWLSGLVATFGVAVRRPWPVATGLAALGLALPLVQYTFRMLTPQSTSWSTLGWAVVINAGVVGWGYAVRTRHALLDSLVERAERAETEAALRADAARAAERTRIAREMHDVLAHRLSLLSMHAGALAHRRHPGPDEVRDAVEVIRANARDALQDLRAILGVLRAPDGDDSGGVEPAGHAPQPTLTDLPRLLDGVRATGTTVDLHDELDAPVPESCGRTLYRVVQEALTNAARHAPGQPVSVRLTGAPGGEVTLEVGNPMGTSSGWSPGAGNGLVGIAERVELAGGRVVARGVDGGRFRLAVAVPWPAEIGTAVAR